MPKSGVKNPAMIVMEITLLKGPLHHSHVAGSVHTACLCQNHTAGISVPFQKYSNQALNPVCHVSNASNSNFKASNFCHGNNDVDVQQDSQQERQHMSQSHSTASCLLFLIHLLSWV